jgi:LPXTG-motif cell wall-anchored protein
VATPNADTTVTPTPQAGNDDRDSDADDNSQPWLPVVGIGALVVLVGGGALWLNRRRRGTGPA